MLGHAQDQGALAQHQQSSADPRHLRIRVRPRLRHGGPASCCRSGFYTYPGAIRAVSINAGTYYQWPIYEGLMWGGVQAALCCLRYFTDDRGRTVVERGLGPCPGRIRRSSSSSASWRSSPRSARASSSSTTFPRNGSACTPTPGPRTILKRSYFNGGICGDGTDVPCPDPVLPMPTKRSGYINNDGQLVLPEGAELPPVIPFRQGS